MGFALQTDLSLGCRLASYLSSCPWSLPAGVTRVEESQYVLGKSALAVVFVETTPARLPGVLAAARADPLLWRAGVASRAFLLERRARKLAVMVERALELDGGLLALGCKVECFPHKLEEEVVPLLRAKGIDAVSGKDAASPVRFYALKKKGKFHFGVVRPADYSFPGVSLPLVDYHTSASGSLCRAGYKMEEVLALGRLSRAHRVVVDIGAAPGGWTAALAMEPGVGRTVFAVDPAELDLQALRAAPGGSVVHVQLKAEEAVGEIEGMLGGGRVDAIVCDANLPPAEALARLIEPFRRLCGEGAALVLTCKCSRHGFLKREVAGAVEEMERWGGKAEVLHLMANTLNERTIVGKMNGGEP